MAGIPKDANGQFVQVLELGPAQNVSFNTTSASSLQLNTNVVRLSATQACYIAVGATPTATTSSTYLPAGVVEYIRVIPGQRIAAIQATTAGILNITENP